MTGSPMDWGGRPADTTPEAWERFLDLQRRMTPSEKLELTLRLPADLRPRIEAERCGCSIRMLPRAKSSCASRLGISIVRR
jgi:hypothetical protein